MGRKIGAVAAGILAGMIFIAAVQAAGHALYAPKVMPDMNDPNAVAAFVAAMPIGAFMSVLIAYAGGTFIGGWMACKVARERPRLYAGIIGALVLVATIANFVKIPHPLWFIVACMVTIPLMAYLAGSAGGVASSAREEPKS